MALHRGAIASVFVLAHMLQLCHGADPPGHSCVKSATEIGGVCVDQDLEFTLHEQRGWSWEVTLRITEFAQEIDVMPFEVDVVG